MSISSEHSQLNPPSCNVPNCKTQIPCWPARFFRRHPDLAGNILRDRDGNPLGVNYDASSNATNPYGKDDNGLGTHLAGIIGAVGNNGVGVVGINWRVRRPTGPGPGSLINAWHMQP
jgi:hypothetical protein